MTWEGLNRRKFPRAHFPCMVKVYTNKSAQDVWLAHTENLSTGGVCIILRKPIEQFKELDFELDLMDGEENIVCLGRVMWVVRRKATDSLKPSWYDVGIEYMNIKEECRNRIAILVEHMARHEYKGKI